MRTIAKAALAAIPFMLGLGAADVEAAGFALKEQSATAQGNAFAGATAGAEDISYMFFNPAALGRLEGHGALAVGNAIMPHSEVTDAAATTVLGAPLAGTATQQDIAKNALVPAFYAMTTPHERLRLGLGFNVPFGLETDYPNDWVGRYHGTNSRLQTFNINPVVAVPVFGGFTFGIGAQIQYIEADLSNRIDLNTISQAGGGPAVPFDGNAEVSGDDWGFGYNMGVLWEYTPSSRVGLAMRSGLDHTLRGEADFNLPAAVAPAFAPLFADTDAQASVDLPPTFSFGLHQDLGNGIAVMGEAAWTRWSTFEELRVEFDNPAQPDSVTTEDWDDSWFFALGATYRPLDQLTLRAGVAYDQTPVPDETRTPRIPGADRYWLSVGVGYEILPNVGLDLAYTHIWMDDSEVDLSAADPENAFRGSLNAQYENSIDLLAISARIRF